MTTTIGNHLGRLLAITEAVTGRQDPGLYTLLTINPAGHFPALMRRAQEGMAKLRGVGRGDDADRWDSRIAAVVESMPAMPLPNHLPLEDQGQFALGYYAERAGE